MSQTVNNRTNSAASQYGHLPADALTVSTRRTILGLGYKTSVWAEFNQMLTYSLSSWAASDVYEFRIEDGVLVINGGEFQLYNTEGGIAAFDLVYFLQIRARKVSPSSTQLAEILFTAGSLSELTGDFDSGAGTEEWEILAENQLGTSQLPEDGSFSLTFTVDNDEGNVLEIVIAGKAKTGELAS